MTESEEARLAARMSQEASTRLAEGESLLGVAIGYTNNNDRARNYLSGLALIFVIFGNAGSFGEFEAAVFFARVGFGVAVLLAVAGVGSLIDFALRKHIGLAVSRQHLLLLPWSDRRHTRILDVVPTERAGVSVSATPDGKSMTLREEEGDSLTLRFRPEWRERASGLAQILESEKPPPTEFSFDQVDYFPDQQTWDDLQSGSYKAVRQAQKSWSTGDLTVRSDSLEFQGTSHTGVLGMKAEISNVREMELVTGLGGKPALRLSYGSPVVVAYFGDGSIMGKRGTAAEIMDAVRTLNPDVRLVASGDDPGEGG